MSNRRRLIALTAVMIALRAAHLYEEMTAGFYMVSVLGLALFVTLNLILVGLIPGILVGLFRGRRWGYWGALAWAAVEFGNGIVHNVAPIVPFLPRLNWAGGLTGIGFLLVSPVFAYVAKCYYAERQGTLPS